jgi:hypothetical protein
VFVWWPKRSTAPAQAGIAAAAAPSADARTVTFREPGDVLERRDDSQQAYGRILLDAIYDRKPFRQALRDLGLTPNQVWGLTKTDQEWATALDAALTATRRGGPQAWDQRRVCRGMCLQGVPGAPAREEGPEP